MSKATKRKHVTKQVLDEYVLPDEKQSIVKVLGGRGNNLHEVEDANGQTFLVSMPTKFRKNVWIKRGDFVLTEPILEGDKVKAEISCILYANQIKYIKAQGKWPEKFSEETQNLKPEDNPRDSNATESGSDSSEDSESSNDDDLFVNTNRPQVTCEESSGDSDSDANSSESEDK